MSRNALIATIIIIIIILAAIPFVWKKGGEQAPAAGEETIKIGMTISLTGKFQDEGHQALCGALAAINWYNKHGGIEVNGKKYKFKLIYYDDQSDKDQVQSLYTKLIEQDKVNFLLAPYSSGLTFAAAPVAEQYKVLMLSHGGASDAIFEQGYKYIVQILTPASRYFEGSLQIVKEKIPDAKIAFIYENAKFSVAVMKGASKIAKDLGLNVVYNQTYQKGQTDFSNLVQEAINAGANVLIGGGHFEDGQKLISTAHQMGWKLKFISILVAPAQPNFPDAVGVDAAIGVAAPAQWAIDVKYSPDNVPPGYTWAGPTKQEWLDEFNNLTQNYKDCQGLKAPAYQAAEAGAAIVFLAEGIKSANSLNSDDVRAAMNNLALYTFFGKLKIDPETGKQIGHEMVVIQWQMVNNQPKLVIIYPPDAATAEPLIAPPNWYS
ncbi:MAG: amino acid ABC transporter substrate-binding protein [Desulfurococcales archaeon]|nr:amino acid ABC transporter substrate-binding protein [Desulfurococcales archaeon]